MDDLLELEASEAVCFVVNRFYTIFISHVLHEIPHVRWMNTAYEFSSRYFFFHSQCEGWSAEEMLRINREKFGIDASFDESQYTYVENIFVKVASSLCSFLASSYLVC